MVTRSWKSAFKVLLLGYWLPTVALGLPVGVPLFWLYLQFSREAAGRPDALGSAGAAERFWPYFGVLVPLILVVVLISGYLSAVAHLTVMKVAVNDATGTPVSLMAAYRSMLRPALPAWGWYLLAGLAAGVGTVACLLPGLYLYVALSLIMPVMLFERRRGLSQSFRLMHANFWPAAGRVLLVLGAVYAVAFPIQMIFQVVNMTVMPGVISGLGAPDGLGAGSLGGALTTLAIEVLVLSLVSLLGRVVVVIGVLATYAELRGRLEPRLDAGQLAAAANR